MTDRVQGGGFRPAPVHTKSERVRPTEVDGARPTVQARLDSHGDISIRTGARATRARGMDVDIKRFFTEVSLPFRSSEYKTERNLRHAEYRLDRRIDRMVEDLVNKGDRLSDKALLKHVEGILREAGHVIELAGKKGEVSGPQAMRERIQTNLDEAMLALQKLAPDKLEQLKTRLSGLTDQAIQDMVRDTVGDLSSTEKGRWGLKPGQEPDPPTSLMKGGATVLQHLRDTVANVQENHQPRDYTLRPQVGEQGRVREQDDPLPTYQKRGLALSGPEMVQWLTQNFYLGESTSEECFKSVENMLHDYAERNNVSVDQAAKELSKALDRALHKELGGDTDPEAIDNSNEARLLVKLQAITQAIGEEDRLTAKLEGHPSFKGLEREDVWKLVVPQREEIGGKLTAEQNECGSLAGSFRGFNKMLESLGEPVTVDWLIDLHQGVTKDNYKTNLPYSEMAVPQGLRHGEGTNLDLRFGKELSESGRNELINHHEGGGGYNVNVDPNKNDISLVFEPKTEKDLRLHAEGILARYHEEIANAGDDPEAKLRAVARATQDLYRSHLFHDGNTRTTVIMMMNRLLLDAGLEPAILDEPRVAGGHSLDEFMQKIREGQERFQGLRDKKEVLIGNIARQISEGTFDPDGLTDMLEEHVVVMAQTDGATRNKALRDLMQALESDSRIGEPERGRITEAIQAARKRDTNHGGRLVEECLVRSRRGDVDYRGVVQEQLARLREDQDPFEALDVLYAQVTNGARPRGQSNDAYMEVRGKLQLAILEARQEILLDRTLGVVTGGLGHEDLPLDDRATGLVQSFLRFAQPLYASPGEALDALTRKLSGKAEDPALRDALARAIEEARTTGDWPPVPLEERQSGSVGLFAQALLGGSKDVRSMDVAPEEGIERFLSMARSIFDTPREALDALRKDLTSLGQRQPMQERLPDVMKALETAYERNVWPS